MDQLKRKCPKYDCEEVPEQHEEVPEQHEEVPEKHFKAENIG